MRIPAQEATQVVAADDGDRGDRSAVDAERLHPAHDERCPSAEALPRVHVFPARVRMPRGQLGEDQRAQQAHCSSERPGNESERRTPDRARHDPGSPEDSRADHDADHQRQSVDPPQRLPQPERWLAHVRASPAGRSPSAPAPRVTAPACRTCASRPRSTPPRAGAVHRSPAAQLSQLAHGETLLADGLPARWRTRRAPSSSPALYWLPKQPPVLGIVAHGAIGNRPVEAALFGPAGTSRTAWTCRSPRLARGDDATLGIDGELLLGLAVQGSAPSGELPRVAALPDRRPSDSTP